MQAAPAAVTAAAAAVGTSVTVVGTTATSATLKAALTPRPAREMQEMDHLSQLELSVPTHLGRNRANDSFDEEKMQDFCLMAKFAFYIGAPLQHLDNSSVGIVQIGDTILRSQQLVYSGAAIRQLKDCINESYEWGLHEAPQMLPKGVMSSR